MSDPLRLQLLMQIRSADHAEELRSLRDTIQARMKALLPAPPVETFNEQLNEVHDAIIKQAVILSEEQMARMGKGYPPVPYAYLLFGSGGREEQTLSSDQDSGIIYENVETDHEVVKQYFEELCALIVAMLETVGYPPCDGKVISTNPDWCMSLTEWNDKLVGWFKEPSWEAVRYLLIIADGRCISGEKQLLVKLKDMFFTDMLNHPVILQRMLENTLRHKMLLGIFGQFLKEQYGEDAGSLDIKYGAYIPMVNSIRLLSVQASIRETSTLGRLRELVRCGEMSETDGLAYEEAFLFILQLRLLATENRSDGYYGNNGKLSSGKLTKEMSEELKRSLRLGKKLQRAVYKRTMGSLS